MKKLIRKLFGIIEINDNFVPKEGRTERQIYNDAVMRISNELVASGVVKIERLECGRVMVRVWEQK